MKKKYLNTLIALALLAGLWGAMTYWDKRKSAEPDKTEKQEKLLTVDKNHVQSISVKPRDGENVTCRRQGGKWAIVEPRKTAADQSAVDSLLSTLTDATIDQTVEPPPKNLGDFGLDRPALSVEISTDAKPEKATVLLGDDTPTSGGVYAQVAGNPRVVILPRFTRTSLDKKAFDLRDKRVMTLDPDQLTRLEAESKDSRWTLVKNPEGTWNLDLPPLARVDRFTVEGLVNRFKSAAMQSIVAEQKENAAKYGFGAPELRIRASGPGGEQTLVLGKKDDGYYFAMNSALDPVFTLDAGFLTQFQKKPDDLRDKDLFSFSTFEVKRLEVEAPSGSRVFEKKVENKATKWKQRAPAAKDLSTDKVETLLNDLRDLRAESFPRGTDLASFGLAKPAYRFKVQFGDKNEEQTVEASKVGEHVYARRSTDAVASEVKSNALDDIEKALKEL
ncbi:MAG TPA: DUF4340 domain-containing protein [Terriglobia bacterium]|nr:DUF4340 domain-containing protein [Terriglobia bacterium]